jgi:tetratricopeptide (TPR) repeat protein
VEKNAARNRLEANVRKNPENPIAHHSYGLVLERFGNHKDAIFHLKTALEKRAFDPYILKDLGKIYFFDGRYQEALSALEGALSISPGEPEATLFAGRVLLGLGRPEEAALRFETIMMRPEYTRVLFFLGEAYGKQGRLGDAHYCLGVYYIREGKLENARFHLTKAKKRITDPEKLAEIEKMLEELKKTP